MKEMQINGILVGEGEYSDGISQASKLNGYSFGSGSMRSQSCFHCNRIKYFNSSEKVWTIKHPITNTIFAKVFQTTSIFQRGFNVILGKHYTGNSLLEILRYGYIFSEYLARQGYSTRMVMNSVYKKTIYGGKEHQHIWVIVTSDLNRFDREFNTRNGYSNPIPGKKQESISTEPYPGDKKIQITYIIDDKYNPMNLNTNFIDYVNQTYPGHNFTEKTSYYLYQERSPGKNWIAY